VLPRHSLGGTEEYDENPKVRCLYGSGAETVNLYLLGTVVVSPLN
jgi:hypothetical protein